ncbi:MAG: hypothetical protein H0T72_05965 [Chloroflexia bacterium]|nr:hypothetical protein [Chloroflexia bacterium]
MPLVVIIPALVEAAKRQGLPVRYAGLAAILCGIGLLALAGVALGEDVDAGTVACWLIGGLVYGLAAAGLYSQREVALGRNPAGNGEKTT